MFCTFIFTLISVGGLNFDCASARELTPTHEVRYHDAHFKDPLSFSDFSLLKSGPSYEDALNEVYEHFNGVKEPLELFMRNISGSRDSFVANVFENMKDTYMSSFIPSLLNTLKVYKVAALQRSPASFANLHRTITRGSYAKDLHTRKFGTLREGNAILNSKANEYLSMTENKSTLIMETVLLPAELQHKVISALNEAASSSSELSAFKVKFSDSMREIQKNHLIYEEVTGNSIDSLRNVKASGEALKNNKVKLITGDTGNFTVKVNEFNNHLSIVKAGHNYDDVLAEIFQAFPDIRQPYLRLECVLGEYAENFKASLIEKCTKDPGSILSAMYSTLLEFELVPGALEDKSFQQLRFFAQTKNYSSSTQLKQLETVNSNYRSSVEAERKLRAALMEKSYGTMALLCFRFSLPQHKKKILNSIENLTDSEDIIKTVANTAREIRNGSSYKQLQFLESADTVLIPFRSTLNTALNDQNLRRKCSKLLKDVDPAVALVYIINSYPELYEPVVKFYASLGPTQDEFLHHIFSLMDNKPDSFVPALSTVFRLGDTFEFKEINKEYAALHKALKLKEIKMLPSLIPMNSIFSDQCSRGKFIEELAEEAHKKGGIATIDYISSLDKSMVDFLRTACLEVPLRTMDLEHIVNEPKVNYPLQEHKDDYKYALQENYAAMKHLKHLLNNKNSQYDKFYAPVVLKDFVPFDMHDSIQRVISKDAAKSLVNPSSAPYIPLDYDNEDSAMTKLAKAYRRGNISKDGYFAPPPVPEPYRENNGYSSYMPTSKHVPTSTMPFLPQGRPMENSLVKLPGFGSPSQYRGTSSGSVPSNTNASSSRIG